MEKAYLSLGTNVGNREKNLREAVNLLHQIAQIKVRGVSSIYETVPWGYKEQNDFLNLCLTIKTEFPPEKLLTVCQQIEDDMGRVRKEKWGPRIIDIDILLYDNLELETPKLVLPHPRIKERAFVLVPLQELNPNLVIAGETIKELLEQVPTEEVQYYSSY